MDGMVVMTGVNFDLSRVARGQVHTPDVVFFEHGESDLLHHFISVEPSFSVRSTTVNVDYDAIDLVLIAVLSFHVYKQIAGLITQLQYLKVQSKIRRQSLQEGPLLGSATVGRSVHTPKSQLASRQCEHLGLM